MVEFKPANEADQIAAKLRMMFYPEFDGVDIVCVFRSEPFQHDPRIQARIEIVRGFKAWLYRGGVGVPEQLFVIQIVFPYWQNKTPAQQIALIDHELYHLDVSPLTGEPCLKDHDIEEFAEIARRHGAYSTSLAIFAEALAEGEQNTDTRAELLAQIFNK